MSLILEKGTAEKYLQVCIEFANESSDWSPPQISKWPVFCTTIDNCSRWIESSDNAHGGFDVTWAYGLIEDDIRDLYKRKYYEEIRFALTAIAETDKGTYSSEELEELLTYFDEMLPKKI